MYKLEKNHKGNYVKLFKNVLNELDCLTGMEVYRKRAFINTTFIKLGFVEQSVNTTCGTKKCSDSNDRK